MAAETDIYREMMQVALAMLAEQNLRISALERNADTLIAEKRKLTADLLRSLRKGEPR